MTFWGFESSLSWHGENFSVFNLKIFEQLLKLLRKKLWRSLKHGQRSVEKFKNLIQIQESEHFLNYFLKFQSSHFQSPQNKATCYEKRSFCHLFHWLLLLCHAFQQFITIVRDFCFISASIYHNCLLKIPSRFSPSLFRCIISFSKCSFVVEWENKNAEKIFLFLFWLKKGK